MNLNEFKEIDEVLRSIETMDDNFMGIELRSIIKDTGLSKKLAHKYLDYLEAKGFVENPWKVEELTEERYAKLTPSGKVFFSETSFEEQMKPKHEAPNTMHVHIGGNNTGNVIVGSTVNDVITKFNNENHVESAGYLEVIKTLIQQSKNEDAAVAFEEFNKQLLEPKHNKPLINILWKTIESAIPHVPQLIEAGHKLLENLHVL